MSMSNVVMKQELTRALKSAPPAAWMGHPTAIELPRSVKITEGGHAVLRFSFREGSSGSPKPRDRNRAFVGTVAECAPRGVNLVTQAWYPAFLDSQGLVSHMGAVVRGTTDFVDCRNSACSLMQRARAGDRCSKCGSRRFKEPAHKHKVSQIPRSARQRVARLDKAIDLRPEVFVVFEESTRAEGLVWDLPFDPDTSPIWADLEEHYRKEGGKRPSGVVPASRWLDEVGERRILQQTRRVKGRPTVTSRPQARWGNAPIRDILLAWPEEAVCRGEGETSTYIVGGLLPDVLRTKWSEDNLSDFDGLGFYLPEQGVRPRQQVLGRD